MLGRRETISLRRGAISVLIALVVAACLCAALYPAWAGESTGDEGDGSEGGGVVQRDASSEEGESDASDSSDSQASSQDEEDGTASVDESDGESTDDAGSPQPLDAEGNVINEGQVSDSSFLYDAAIADLAGADSYYNGQTVQVTGEAVGEAIVPLGSSGEGSDQVRVTLYEAASGSSITVCMTADDAAKIKIYGAYGKTGTTLCVQGTFNLACKEHEGESDIHADTVVVVSQGSVHPDSINPEEFIPGAAALAIGFVLMIVFWRIKERSR